MATKLPRKSLPKGKTENDFKYVGSPAKEQNSFDGDIGLADMSCVSQFGENKAKYYHVGIVESDGNYYVYTEWGRIFEGKSWDGFFRGQDFQFMECFSFDEAKKEFIKKCKEKNTKRLEKKEVGGKTRWVGKSGKDGYVVQSLATRQRGLPDAYSIKDDEGLQESKKTKKKTKKKTSSKKKYQPEVVHLAQSLVGGTRDYTRAASQASGVIPTVKAIQEVRDDLIPAALQRIQKVGNKIEKQIKDKELIEISNYVAALVPRPIPRHGSAEQRAKTIILSSENILSIQNDLDAYESSLKNEDFDVENEQGIAPDEIFNAQIEWISPTSKKGKWVIDTYKSMTNHKHSYIPGQVKVRNVFEVYRDRVDNLFVEEVKKFKKKKEYKEKARLQPKSRFDVEDIADYYENANVFLGIHGTRPINVHPIISSNLRLPKNLSNVVITGAAFGPGIYYATDYKKSYGYTGFGNSYWTKGGTIPNRGFFMFLCDVIMGDAYMAGRSGSWQRPPNNKDSIAAYPEYSSVQNDEHIIFDPNRQRIRYIIEGDL